MDSPDKDPNHTVENAQSIDPPEVGSAPKSEPGDQAPSPVEEPAPVAEVVEATTEPEIDPLDALRQENERVRGQLLRVAADFSAVSTQVADLSSPADITVDEGRKRILIPRLLEDRAEFHAY